METADIAREALRILDRDGWNKGMLTAPAGLSWGGAAAGSHCIGGAWNLALHGIAGWWLGDESYDRIAEVIVAQYPQWAERREVIVAQYPQWAERRAGSAEHFIAEWNNDEATTEGDVRAVLEKIAAG